MIPLWSIPIATATGNCLILKPSERDPGAAMILAELAEKAGFPPGVLNVVTADVAKSRPADVAAVVRGYIQASRDFAAHPRPV